jgi:putative addiction module antidote
MIVDSGIVFNLTPPFARYTICDKKERSMKTTVTQIGASTGIILPEKAVDRLKLKTGDCVYLTETPHGYAITPCNPEFVEQMESARLGMDRYRNALRKLAK